MTELVRIGTDSCTFADGFYDVFKGMGLQLLMRCFGACPQGGTEVPTLLKVCLDGHLGFIVEVYGPFLVAFAVPKMDGIILPVNV